LPEASLFYFALATRDFSNFPMYTPQMKKSIHCTKMESSEFESNESL